MSFSRSRTSELRDRSAGLPPRASVVRGRSEHLRAASSERPVWPAELGFRAGGQRRRSLALRNRSADERLCSPELRVGRAEDQSRRAESGRDIARDQNKTARRRVAGIEFLRRQFYAYGAARSELHRVLETAEREPR